MLALKDVKNYLNITWEDEDTDSRVKGAAARAPVLRKGAYRRGGLAVR